MTVLDGIDERDRKREREREGESIGVQGVGAHDTLGLEFISDVIARYFPMSLSLRPLHSLSRRSHFPPIPLYRLLDRHECTIERDT